MKILVFAPHNDDEVLGVGGTIAKLVNQGNEVFVCETTSGPNYVNMQRQAKDAHNILGVKESFFLNLPVSCLKEISTPIKNDSFLTVVKEIRPEIAFIPHMGDMHVDHGETALAAMVALRPINNPQLKSIYTYETLSETEWNIPNTLNAFIPNVWSDITETIEVKLNAMKCFTGQLKQFPHPRSLEAIMALAKFRGSTIGKSFAEAFMLVREIL